MPLSLLRSLKPSLADWVARSRGENKRDDEAVETQHLGEDEYEDHANVEARLLSRAAHARVAHDADGKASRQARQANAQTGAQVVKAPF